MLVVCDASPISALITVGRAEILQKMFGEVVVREAVFAELSAFHTQMPAWARVVPVRDAAKVERFAAVLDRGESEALVLAVELHADFLLMDEKAGREVAVREGLRVVGLLGVALRAKDAGFLGTSMVQLVSDLEQMAGFRMSAELKSRVLLLAGEA